MKKQIRNKQKTQISPRLNILFLCVFLLFSFIVVQLGRVQIINGETYANELQKNDIVSIPVPRGKIYDREGKIVVDNKSLRTITYTKSKGVNSEEVLKIAKDLANVLEIPEKDINKVTEIDKKDFWMELNKDRTEAKISKHDIEKLKKQNIVGKELDKKVENLRRDRITAEELEELTPQHLKVLTIKNKMNFGYQMTPQIIKEDATEQEYAIVSESLERFPGVDATVSWERNYENGTLFRSVLGRVTTSEEGLPQEHLDSYLVRGYDRNDRVGKSYIEQKYEGVLQGEKEEMKINTDKSGNIIQTETVSKGQSGNNLTLTIDIELQKKVEEIIEKNLRAFESSEPLMDRAFVVMMNPKSGQLLSMAGKKLVKENGKTEVEDFALGNIITSYEMGSAVKGATLLTGYETGAILIGEQ
ncbi:serine-type D-Ala-D-Ala carboxypeptidase [Bacillus manliponensis]